LSALTKKRPRGCEIPLDAQHHIHDLAALVDRSVEVAPPSGDLDAGLVDEPTVGRSMPAVSGGVDELRRESQHPPVDRHMINGDSAFGQQLLEVTVGQPYHRYHPSATAITFRRMR
jgi:hypothetical protein